MGHESNSSIYSHNFESELGNRFLQLRFGGRIVLVAINLSNVLFHGEICLFFAQWEISNKLLEFSPQGGIEAIKGPHITKIVF